jgi:membrane-bound metal-dependent hydrolase YbcI (DUF457 family)
MLAGHLAVALGTKRIEPTLPLWALVGAALWLDLLWPVLLLSGIEAVRVSPGDTAFTNLAFDRYPWTHSLVMSMAWAAAAAALARALRMSWRGAVTLGALVLSHWVLDFVTHRPDLPLWPDGPTVGLGLWDSIAGTLAVEGAIYLAAVWLYVRGNPGRDRVGRLALLALALFIGLLWVTQPVAPPPPSDGAVAWGALTMWLLLPWAAWIDRHRGMS